MGGVRWLLFLHITTYPRNHGLYPRIYKVVKKMSSTKSANIKKLFLDTGHKQVIGLVHACSQPPDKPKLVR